MREVAAFKHLPAFVLVLLFAAGATLWLLFVQEQQSRVESAFQNQLDRVSDELLRGRLEGRVGPDSLPEGVRAFAVYGPRGEAVVRWGDTAPQSIDPRPKGRGPNRLVRDSEQWVSLTRVLQPLRPRLALWTEEEGPPPPPSGRRPLGFVYLNASAEGLTSRQWAWTLGGAAGIAAWAGFITFVGVLWYRTRRYQAAMAHHRELLQFTEASRTLGHELQNPLAAILLQTALLKRSGRQESEILVIEEEAQRMSALVARVRDFLKDPRGQAEAIDAVEFVSSLKDRFSIPIGLNAPAAALLVRFDRHRLRSVIENLLKNAVESGPDPRPQVTLSRVRGQVRIDVEDSGVGFSPETLKKGLQPFFTTKIAGTGIGLSIADGFVRAAGGRLRLENRPEGGARVTIELPEAVS